MLYPSRFKKLELFEEYMINFIYKKMEDKFG